MAVNLFKSVREAREAVGLSRKEAAPTLHMSPRTIEQVEYERTPVSPEVARMAAEAWKAPELALQVCGSCAGGFPKLPSPKRIDSSLMANLAKGAKEAREASQVMDDLVHHLYGKSSGDDLTEKDRREITRVIRENAQAVYVFTLLCILLVKQFGFDMAAIEDMISAALREDGLV